MGNVRKLVEFQDTQRAFALHLRDPALHACPDDVSDRRMKIYRDLFFKNITGFISNGFPVLKKFYSEQDWLALVRGFYHHHRCKTPYFPEIGSEFLEYLQTQREMLPTDPEFMIELAHYEWVELALDISLDEISASTELTTPLLEACVELSPVAWSLNYAWPVHKLGPAYWPSEQPAERTYLLVYRNRDDRVRFMEINVVTARLLELIKDKANCTVSVILEQLADELSAMVERDKVIQMGQEMLSQLISVDAILVK